MTPKTKRTLTTVALLGVGAIACPLLRMINPEPPDWSESRAVYHWHDGQWTATAPTPGGNESVAVAADGSVWAMPPSRSGINRWDGARWVHYGARDFGGARDDLPGGFAVDGKEVWLAAREGVARWNGNRWHYYPHAVRTRTAVSIAAGPSGVWVLDALANVSHFDGEHWTIEALKSTPAGADGSEDADGDRPQMQLRETADGAIWLLREQMWRNAGDGWRAVQNDKIGWSSASIAGAEGPNLWIRGHSHLVELKPDGSVGRVIDRRDLPIPSGAQTFNVALADGKIWLATAKDLLIYDGRRWQQCGIPTGTTIVREVALAPDGTAWSVGESRSLMRIAMWIALPLAGAAFALLAIGTLLVMWVKGKAGDRLAADQVVVQAAGNVPGLDI